MPKASFTSVYLTVTVQSVIWVKVRKQWIFRVFYYVKLGNEMEAMERLLWSFLNLQRLKLKLPSEEICFLLQGFFLPTWNSVVSLLCVSMGKIWVGFLDSTEYAGRCGLESKRRRWKLGRQLCEA